MSVGGTTTYDKIPELHDAALKLLAKHGIPWSKIRKGMAMTWVRNADYLSVDLSYLTTRITLKRSNELMGTHSEANSAR